MPAIYMRNVVYSYRAGKEILRIPRFDVARGERVFVFGQSGSGKTTLLGLVAGVLHGQKGEIQVLNEDLQKMSGHRRDAFRGTHIGYIFQLFNLISYLNVIDNIMLPCRLISQRRRRLGETDLRQAAETMASQLGVEALLSAIGRRATGDGALGPRLGTGPIRGWRWRGCWACRPRTFG